MEGTEDENELDGNDGGNNGMDNDDGGIAEDAVEDEIIFEL